MSGVVCRTGCRQICDDLYAAGPIVRNEILNRRQLSSQGAAARRNLIEGMLLRGHLPALGIDGYPPERSMYESLLSAGKLHQERADQGWGFGPPPPDDRLHLLPVWNAIGDYIFALPPQPRSVQDLFVQSQSATLWPNGWRAPVLLCAFLIVHQQETTLYTEGSLLPSPDIADWEVLLRRPELFTVAGCRIVGPRLAVVERLARGLQTQPAAMPIVRELIRRIKSLPEHVLRTQKLSAATLLSAVD